MKKSIVLGILGLATAAVTSYGQGYISLDNYSSGVNTTPISYGANVPLNGVSGPLGTLGAGITSDWTAGLYWVAGTTGLSQAAGTGMPDASLTLGTGPGSTVVFATGNTGLLGFFASAPSFNAGAISTLTLEIVVYPTADGSYVAAQNRGHSAAFSLPTTPITNPNVSEVGDYMQAFSVNPVPEPTTLALGGLGGLALLLIRRKQS